MADTPLKTEPAAEPKAIDTPAPPVQPIEQILAEKPVEANRVEAEMAKAPESALGAASAKPEVAPPKVEAKPTEVPPVEAPPPHSVEPPAPLEPLVYTDFTLPEGMTVEDLPSMSAFKDILGKNRGSQEFGQALVDFYTAEVQKARQVQEDVWKKTNDDWRSAIEADPELGGNRKETVLHTVASVITEYGGTPEQQTLLRQVFNYTGAGNHPEVVRFVYRLGKALGEGRPVPAPTPRNSPNPISKAQRRYAGNGAQATG